MTRQRVLDVRDRRIFLYTEEIDMRLGFERLFYFVREKLKQDALLGHVYLFLGKNRKRAKVFLFDGTGLVLLTKRLERGRFQALGELRDRGELTHEELEMILNGTHVNFTFSSMEELARDFFKARPMKPALM